MLPKRKVQPNPHGAAFRVHVVIAPVLPQRHPACGAVETRRHVLRDVGKGLDDGRDSYPDPGICSHFRARIVPREFGRGRRVEDILRSRKGAQPITPATADTNKQTNHAIHTRRVADE